MIGNSPRFETNIAVEASKSYALRVSIIESSGQPVDLQGSKLRFVAATRSRRSASEVLDFEVDGTPSGVVKFMFQASDLSLPVGEYPYDITLVAPTGYSTPLVKGTLEIGPNVDSKDDNRYSDVNVGAGIIVTLTEGGLIQVSVESIDGMFNAINDLVYSFRDYLDKAKVNIDSSAKAAADSAEHAASYIAGLMAYLASIGFPYWVGTLAEYQALTEPSPLVMYLIKD